MLRNKIYIAFILLVSIVGGLPASGISEAMTARQAYFGAESCYKKLRSSSAKMKYRENWLRCIEKFQTVYRLDPDGSWAAAGLYMSGKLYKELAKRSGASSDRQETLDIFERIIKRYPQSKYRSKAAAEIRSLSASGTTPNKTTSAQSPPRSRPSAEEDFQNAEACYSSLKQSSRKMAYRHNWMQCIEKFYSIYRQDPDGDRAAPSLFMTGMLYADLYRQAKRKSDLQAAHTMYAKVIASFPDSRYKVKASLLIDAMPQWVKKDTDGQNGDLAKAAGNHHPQPAQKNQPDSGPDPSVSEGRGTVDSLRFWSNPNYTRVVIDASRETAYNHHLLKKDPTINKPQRLYVDLKNSRLGRNVRKSIPINDDLLSDARAGQ